MNKLIDNVTDAMVNESLKEHLKDVVRELAMQRVVLLKLHVMSEDEITEFINKYGEEFTKEFSGKDPIEIILGELKKRVEG